MGGLWLTHFTVLAAACFSILQSPPISMIPVRVAWGGGAVPQHRVFFLSTLLTLTEHYALLIAKEIILELLSGGGIITEDHERCKYLFWNELIPSGRLLTFLLLLKVLETYRLDKMQFRLEKKKLFLRC